MPNTRPLVTDRLKLKGRNLVDRTMTYTCTVKRGGTPGTTTGYNQPGKPADWPDHLPDQQCGYKASTVTVNTGEQQNKDRSIVYGRKQMKFPYGTDVGLKDRVYDLRDRDGNLVEPGAQYFDVKELLPSDFNLKVIVEAIY